LRRVDEDTPIAGSRPQQAIAIAQRDGPDRGIEEILAITDRDRLKSYPFYWAAFGEFDLRSKRYETAHSHFRSALAFA
jgi:RNA polymerase sigma-70 factor (ECF subfamily)